MKREIRILARSGLSWLLTLSLCTSFMVAAVFAAPPDTSGYSRDKGSNTAYISKKEAAWTDAAQFTAELTLAVNGTQVQDPLDVVICYDRSGSMDMDFVNSNSGVPYDSCVCLNQDHFYLGVKDGVVPLVPSNWNDIGLAAQMRYQSYDPGTKELTVYNAEKGALVVLDAGNPVHLYSQMIKTDYYEPYAPYHFKLGPSNEYVRISKWDTTDIRKKTNAGLWDHADKNEGCIDRLMQANTAVKEFSQELVTSGDNRVALVPFSLRDSTMKDFLNSTTTKEYRNWLLDPSRSGDYFNTTTGLTVTGTTADADPFDNGTYNTVVPFRDTSSVDDIGEMLDCLFTTVNTDYIYGLSQAYNLLAGRSPAEKNARRGVVVFISDGKPYTEGTYGAPLNPYSFANQPTFIDLMVMAIKNPSTDLITDATKPPAYDFFKATSYLRHDITSSFIQNDGQANEGVYALGAEIVSVGYMVPTGEDGRLRSMASNPAGYISVNSNAQGAGSDALKNALLDANLFPGGREAVLYDKISKYSYIPDSPVITGDLRNGVTINGTKEAGQTIVWDIVSIYAYAPGSEPTIKVPLVLREEYRKVSSTTYYPTNADNPEPSLTDPSRGPDGPDTGAKLFYKNPEDTLRYDTIGTPKLPVTGSGGGGQVPPDPKPEPKPDPKPEPKPDPKPEPEPEPNPNPEPEPNPEPPRVPPVNIPNPSDPNAPDFFVLVDEDGTPLGYYQKVTLEDGTVVYVDERGTPLGSFTLPQTGDSPMPLFWGILLAGSLLSATCLLPATASRRRRP